MAAKLSVRKLMDLETPPELDDVPRRGTNENGALHKAVASADHWFRACMQTAKELHAAENKLLILRSRLLVLRWPRRAIGFLFALNVAQAVVSYVW